MKKLLIVFVLLTMNCIAQEVDSKKKSTYYFSKVKVSKNENSTEKNAFISDSTKVNTFFLKTRVATLIKNDTLTSDSKIKQEELKKNIFLTDKISNKK